MTQEALKLEKKLEASPEAVFDAWTNPESMASWFSPMTTASIPVMDLRVGGDYRIDMHGDGKDYVHTGKYLEVDRPGRLKFSWHSEGTGQEETIVTLDIKSDGDGSMLTLTHEKLPNEQSRDDHEKGWMVILEKLPGVLVG